MNYFLETYRRDTGEPVPVKDRNRFKPENLIEKFPPEYAHIIGVPFKMFKGGTTTVVEPPDYTNIRALPGRQKEHEIIFPNLIGYRVENLDGELKHDFSGIENYELVIARVETGKGETVNLMIEISGMSKDRFPEDFMFQVTEKEWKNLKSQIVTSRSRNPNGYKTKK